VNGSTSTSRVVPQLREVWQAADGSGRILTAELIDSAVPDAPLVPGTTRDDHAGLGTLSRPAARWSEDPVALAAQLDAGHPSSAGASERLVAVADVYRTQYVPPRLAAALLRVVASSPGVRLDGRTVDRVGRPGLAVSAMNGANLLPQRTTLVFDEDTGRLLDVEQTLTERAGALDVQVPAVVSYQVFLAAGRVDSVQQRP
jgi:hypothetical protein